jgi:hypothetical protein
VEKTFKRIKDFYNFKLKHKSETRDIIPSKLRKVFETELVQILPNRDADGRRIYVVNIGSK